MRNLRQAAAFSQENFALHVDLHPNYYSSIERSERNVAYLNLCKIAEGFGISISELLDLKSPVPQAVIELGERRKRQKQRKSRA